MSAVHSYPPSYPPPPSDPNRGLRTAGTVAIWVWILIALLPVLAIAGCIALCFFGGVMNEINPDPDPTFSWPSSSP